MESPIRLILFYRVNDKDYQYTDDKIDNYITTSERIIVYMQKAAPNDRQDLSRGAAWFFSMILILHFVGLIYRKVLICLLFLYTQEQNEKKPVCTGTKFLLVWGINGRRAIDLSGQTCFVRRIRKFIETTTLKRIVGVAFNGRRLRRLRFYLLNSLWALFTDNNNKGKVFYRGEGVLPLVITLKQSNGANTPFCGESLKSDCNFFRFVVFYSCDTIQ